MGWLDALEIVGGGARGLLGGLSWQQEQQAEKRRRLQEEQRHADQLRMQEEQLALGERNRRDRNNDRQFDIMTTTSAALDAEEGRRRQETIEAAKKKMVDEWMADLPPEMRQFFKAKEFGATNVSPDDFLSPEQREARDQKKRDEDKRKRDAEFGDFKRRESFKNSLEPAAPITPKDDPSLPFGVRSYLDAMLDKHAGDFDAAVTDLNRTWTQLKRDHPSIDPGKARKYLVDVFGYEKPEKPDRVDRLLQSDLTQATPSGPPVTPFRAKGYDDNRVPPSSTATLLRQQEHAARIAVDETRAARLARGVGHPDPQELRDGVTRPGTDPVEIETPGTEPPSPRSAGSNVERLQRLETQLRSMMDKFRVEHDPGQRDALKRELRRLRDGYVAAGGK